MKKVFVSNNLPPVKDGYWAKTKLFDGFTWLPLTVHNVATQLKVTQGSNSANILYSKNFLSWKDDLGLKRSMFNCLYPLSFVETRVNKKQFSMHSA